MVEDTQKREQRLAARDARRAVQRETALHPVAVVEPEPKNWVTVLVSAGGTALWLGLANWSYTAATGGDMIGAAVILTIAFFVAMGALLTSERYGGFGNKKRMIVNLSVAAGLLIASVALFWWEYAHRPSPPATPDDIARKVIQGLPQPAVPAPKPPPFVKMQKAEETDIIDNRAIGGPPRTFVEIDEAKRVRVVGNEHLSSIPVPAVRSVDHLADDSNEKIKKRVIEFSAEMRAFDQGYDKGGKDTPPELNARFVKLHLADARDLESEILWRLKNNGNNKIDLPPLPNRTQIGYTSLQLGGLFGGSPTDIGLYLTFLAEKLPN